METSKISQHFIGKKLDLSEYIMFDTATLAQNAFDTVRRRLLDVNRWYTQVEQPMVTFEVTDARNVPLDRSIRLGDYIRIDIPGPNTKTGGGYNWVTVTHMDDRPDDGELTFTFRPSPNPILEESNHTNHFFSQYASSTFLLCRENKRLQLSYAGRNEEINLDNSNLSDFIRNTLVGSAAKIGFSEPHWKKLIVGMLKDL